MMAIRNPWLRPAGNDGFIPVVVLWERFANLYGARWRALHGGDAARQAWQEDAAALFYERGIRWAMAKRAVDALRLKVKGDSEPPGLLVFADMCLPNADFESAFAEAQRNAGHALFGEVEWSSPAVYWAARDYGFSRMQAVKWSRAKGDWVRLLSERLTGVCPAIPDKPEQRAFVRGDQVKASETVAGLKALLDSQTR